MLNSALSNHSSVSSGMSSYSSGAIQCASTFFKSLPKARLLSVIGPPHRNEQCPFSAGVQTTITIRPAKSPAVISVLPDIRTLVGQVEHNRDRWCAQPRHAISIFDIGGVMGTNVNLTPELERFAQACVESGRFNNVSEVVRSGLRMLQEAEERRSAFVASLRAAREAGLRDGLATVADVAVEVSAAIDPVPTPP